MPNGTATLNFGAIGSQGNWASVDVTGQSGIVATSRVGAWIRLEETAEHSADEVMVEDLSIYAGNIIPGTGFTIYGRCNNGRFYGTVRVDWAWV